MKLKFLPIDIKLYIINNFITKNCYYCEKKILNIFSIKNIELCKKCFLKERTNLLLLFDNND